MATSEPIDPGGIGVVDALATQQLLGVGARQVAHRETREQRPHREGPVPGRRVTISDHDADVIVDQRHEGLPDPRVDGPQLAVPVDDEDDAATTAT